MYMQKYYAYVTRINAGLSISTHRPCNKTLQVKTLWKLYKRTLGALKMRRKHDREINAVLQKMVDPTLTGVLVRVGRTLCTFVVGLDMGDGLSSKGHRAIGCHYTMSLLA